MFIYIPLTYKKNKKLLKETLIFSNYKINTIFRKKKYLNTLLTIIFIYLKYFCNLSLYSLICLI